MPKKQTRLLILSIGCALALAFHFTMVLVYFFFWFNDEVELVDPERTPFRELDRFSRNYIHPLFAQDWFLFAPRPVYYTDTILLRGKTVDKETGAIAAVSDWYSVNEYMIAEIRNNRWSRMNFYRNTFSQNYDPILWNYSYKNHEIRADRAMARNEDEAKIFLPLERFGSRLLRMMDPGRPYDRMDAMVIVTYADRHDTGKPAHPTETILIENLEFIPERADRDVFRRAPR